MLRAVLNETLENTITGQEYSSGFGISLGSKYHKMSELQGPLEVVWSNHPAQAGPPRAGYQGLCPDSF